MSSVVSDRGERKRAPSAIPRLRTGLITLRFPRRDDFPLFADFYASPRSRYLGGPLTRETAWQNFVTDICQWGVQGYASLAIDINATGRCAGMASLSYPPSYPEREVSVMLWEEYEGRGYAFEAAQLVRHHAFEGLRWPAAVSYVAPHNGRAIRLAKRMQAVHDPNAAQPAGPPCLVFRHLPPSDAPPKASGRPGTRP